MDKTFTLDEAQMLLPILESLLRRAIDAKARSQQLQQQTKEVAHRVVLSGGMLLSMSETAARRAEYEKAEQALRDSVQEIDSLGVQVKDLDIGLLDFPCEVDGDIILLCWKVGEPRIAHWHSLTEGFRGRKPITDKIAKAKPDRPN